MDGGDHEEDDDDHEEDDHEEMNAMAMVHSNRMHINNELQLINVVI